MFALRLGAVLLVHGAVSTMTVLFVVCPAATSESSAESSQCFVNRSFTSSMNKSNTLGLLVLLPNISLVDHESERDPIKLSGWDHYLSVIPALDLAVEQINNMTDFLPCHHLRLIYRETGCNIDVSTTLLSLTSSLFPGPRQNTSDGSTLTATTIVGAIGPVCSESAIRVSALTNRPDLRLVVLHTSDTSELADRQKYPYSLGVLGSTQPLVRLSLALVNENAWHNVTILYDGSHSYYSSIVKDLVTSLETSNVTLNYLPLIAASSRQHYPLDKVISSKIRIVFVFTSTEHSTRIMCLAHHMNLLYPRYQWVFFNWQLDDFKHACRNFISFYQWGRHYNCSCQQLVVDSLEGAFMINHQMMSSSFSQGLSKSFPHNLSLREFIDLYNHKVNVFNAMSGFTIYPTRWAHIMYDAVWAWGVVLNRLTTATGNGDAFGYGDERSAEALLDGFYSINYQGISGHIRLNPDNGYVDRFANLYQVRGGVEKHIAYSNKTTVVLSQTFEHIPDVVQVVNLPNIGFVSVLLTIHFLEIVAIIALQVLTFLYRNTKFVKASSPKLIQPAFAGAYISLLCFTLYQTFFTHKLSHATGTALCYIVWVWLLPISYTLMMGVITLRAWRLYRIFTHYLNPGKSISNIALLTILTVLVLIDVLISTIWTAASPVRLELTADIGKINDTVLIDQRCHTKPQFWILVYTYKFSLLFAMITLSILTHRIPNQAFSTQLLRVYSYLFSLSFVLGLSLYYLYVFVDRISHADYFIFSALSNTLILLFITLVVLPPLLPVIQHKLKRL